MSLNENEIAAFTRMWKRATETWGGALTFAGTIMFAVSMITVPLAFYMRAHGHVARMPVGTVTLRCERSPQTSCSVMVSPP
jgi:hypothetical protein